MNYLELRKKYSEFIYRKYDVELQSGDLILNYYYDILPGHAFKHTIKINEVPNVLEISKFKNLIFNIGLTEMFSYWKLTAAPKISVKAGNLNDFQNEWWKKLLRKGMSQYFYENKINFTAANFVEIVSQEEPEKTPLINIKGNKVLIPVGGGKDSAVTLEILSGTKNEVASLVVNPTKASLGTIKESGVKKVIEIERTIDSRILRLNKKGYLNGHVPFSASLAFIGTLTSCLFGYKHLAFSNERSADEENAEYLGQKINHQYSKTLEFENDFRDYNRKHLSNVNYFSFLRPLYEIQIAKIFSRYEKYFDVIRSCNIGTKENVWCRSCPKCLSTFILLYPFLGETKTGKMFSKNLIKDPKLSGLLSELIDESKVKPFECVGTKEELRAVLSRSYQNLLNAWGEHNVPAEFVGILKEALA